MVNNEPTLRDESYFNSRVVRDIGAFKTQADLIITNRRSKDLEDVVEKVFTRDLFGAD